MHIENLANTDISIMLCFMNEMKKCENAFKSRKKSINTSVKVLMGTAANIYFNFK